MALDRARGGYSNCLGDDRPTPDPPVGRHGDIGQEQRDRRFQIRDRGRHLCRASGLFGHRGVGKINDAQTTVAEEAGAMAALFRYAEGKEPEAIAVRAALVNYLKTAIDEEWPAMSLESEAHGVVALNRDQTALREAIIPL
jgi:hypothetical protein